MPDPTDTETHEALTTLLVAHQRIPLFRGSVGQRCTGCDSLYGEPDGPNSPRHAAHLAAVLTAHGWGRLPDAETVVADGEGGRGVGS
jgi:hypothetical protein